MAISYITWEISPRCNMDCGFCFSDWRESLGASENGANKKYVELSTADARRVIDFLADQKVEALNFTGGEPLMKQDIGELIAYAKQKGLTTILTTNGLLLEQMLADIAPNIDFIGLPLDSALEEVHNSMRNAPCSHYRLVLDMIDKIHNDYPEIGIKLNTLVSKMNIDTVEGIGEIVGDKIATWKLSPFVPYGFGAKHCEEYELGEGEYMRKVAECRARYPSINIIAPIPHSLDDACRVISADGHLLKPTLDGLKDLGELLRLSSEELFEGFNEKLNRRHLKTTYSDHLPSDGGDAKC